MQKTHPILTKLFSAMALALTSTLAQAADPVTDAMQAANAPYRMALYKTNGNSAAEAKQALEQAQAAWEKLASQFGKQPAAPYDRDAGFAESLAAASKVYVKAMAEVNAGDLKAAHATLEDVRDIMSDLRKRNQVVVFSDQMNAYHAVMEHILIDGHAMLAEPKGLLLMTAQAGTLSYLAKRLTSEVPVSLTQNPEFTALAEAVKGSVAKLEAALLTQDMAAVKEAMGKLKGPYSKLFSKFG